MEDFWCGIEMEWKKIASMEYGKIVFHTMPWRTFRARRHFEIKPIELTPILALT